MSDHKPSDHILDEFLAKHRVKVSIREFGGLLGSLRESMAAEALPPRERVEDEVREALEDLGITAYPTSARNDAEEPIGVETVAGHVTGYVLALLRRDAS